MQDLTNVEQLESKIHAEVAQLKAHIEQVARDTSSVGDWTVVQAQAEETKKATDTYDCFNFIRKTLV
jgi:hypothetical protein